MKFKYINLVILSFLLAVIVVSFPQNVAAEEGDDQDSVLLLENSLPLDGINKVVKQGQLGTYLNGLFFLGIGIASGLAIIYIAIGGVQYMVTTADKDGKKAGRDKITSAVGGLVLALAAFVILNTINPELLKFNITTAIQDIVNANEGVGKGGGSGSGGDGDGDGYSAAAEKEARKLLALLGIGIINPCPIGENRSDCTNVGGLPQSAMQGLAATKNNCGNFHKTSSCTVEVTGGTEPGHKEHGQGKPIVDIRPNQALNSYIQDSHSPNNPPHKYSITRDGAKYTFEAAGVGTSTGDHWHVIYP